VEATGAGEGRIVENPVIHCENLVAGSSSRARAMKLEERFGLDPEGEGQFGQRHGKLGIADKIGAGWIVYLAVIAAWLLVAGYGLQAMVDWTVETRAFAAGGVGVLYVGAVVLVLSPRYRKLWVYREAEADDEPPDRTPATTFGSQDRQTEQRRRTGSPVSRPGRRRAAAGSD
jgi:hypothetical protein